MWWLIKNEDYVTLMGGEDITIEGLVVQRHTVQPLYVMLDLEEFPEEILNKLNFRETVEVKMTNNNIWHNMDTEVPDNKQCCIFYLDNYRQQIYQAFEGGCSLDCGCYMGTYYTEYGYFCDEDGLSIKGGLCSKWCYVKDFIKYLTF